MGSSVSFYCGPEDTKALVEYAESLGLSLIGMTLDRLEVERDPKRGPFCYLSFLNVGDLHPYGTPAINISDATDPLIELLRSYYDPPYLVSGRIYWSNDVPEFAKRTKPYFVKLKKWVQQNWAKRPDSAFYFGPEANLLVEEEGAEPVTFHPDKIKGEVIVTK